MNPLIDAVLKDPVAVLHGTSAAAEELVRLGPAALPAIQHAIDGERTSSAHPVDVVEALMLIARRIRDDSGDHRVG